MDNIQKNLEDLLTEFYKNHESTILEKNSKKKWDNSLENYIGLIINKEFRLIHTSITFPRPKMVGALVYVELPEFIMVIDMLWCNDNYTIAQSLLKYLDEEVVGNLLHVLKPLVFVCMDDEKCIEKYSRFPLKIIDTTSEFMKKHKDEMFIEMAKYDFHFFGKY